MILIGLDLSIVLVLLILCRRFEIKDLAPEQHHLPIESIHETTGSRSVYQPHVLDFNLWAICTSTARNRRKQPANIREKLMRLLTLEVWGKLSLVNDFRPHYVGLRRELPGDHRAKPLGCNFCIVQ